MHASSESTRPRLKKRLWYHLRNRQIAGCKFRRQVPIERYIADFVCFEHRLVLEVDGGQHASDVERDERRTAQPNADGFTVIRFWNNDVLENTEGVLTRIAEILADRDSPSPRPSPARGEGEEN